MIYVGLLAGMIGWIVGFRMGHKTGYEKPDPLLVCPNAKKCSHVDGYLCEPHVCADNPRATLQTNVEAEPS